MGPVSPSARNGEAVTHNAVMNRVWVTLLEDAPVRAGGGREGGKVASPLRLFFFTHQSLRLTSSSVADSGQT